MSNPPDLTLESRTETVRAAREESPAAATASSTEPSPPAHLEAALAEATGAAGATPSAPPAPVLMPRSEWCDLYLKCHGIAGHAMGSRVLAGVPERAGGTEAAGAIYDTCAETPYLHFLLHPGGKWFQRAMMVGYFYAPIVGALRAERARRQAPRVPRPRDTESPAEVGGLAMPPNGAV